MAGERRLQELRPSHTPAEGLGRASPLLAALGLVVLMLCTVPAIAEHKRLLAEHARARATTEATEEALARLRRELRDDATQRYLRVRARERLAWHGRTYLKRRDARLAALARRPR